jgi:hypothetical protein
MKSKLAHPALAVSLIGLVVITLTLSASAREVVLPAGTLLQCTLNEPNSSSATVDVGDPSSAATRRPQSPRYSMDPCSFP